MTQTKDDRRFQRLETLTFGLRATVVLIQRNHLSACVVPVRDFSRGGVGLYMPVAVDEGTQVRLSFENLDFAPIVGHVTYCLDIQGDPNAPAQHHFRIGVEFYPSDDADRDNQIAMYAYISKLVEEREPS